MRDKRASLAFLVLLSLLVALVYLSLEKTSHDRQQDTRIDYLSEDLEKLTNKVSKIKTVKGEDGYTPVKGVDYFDGINAKTPKDGKDAPIPTNGRDGVSIKGEKGDPAPELDIECIDGKIMKKYIGDSFAQPTNIKCEAANE